MEDTSWYVTTYCKQCRNSFRAKRKSKWGEPRKFCTRKCLLTYRNTPIEFRCIACGEIFTVIRYKINKSKPERKFCSHKCKQFYWETIGKTDKRTYEGKKHFSGSGYIYIHAPEHPSVKGKNYRYVAEHRLVMEKHLRRYLETGENVHHKNGDKHDNRLSNLELWTGKQPYGQRVDDLMEEIKALKLELKQLKEI